MITKNTLCIGLLFGKFDPFHKGHEMLVREALEQCDLVYMLVYDHPGLNGIPTEERIKLIEEIISDDNLKLIGAYNSPSPGDSSKIRQTHTTYMAGQLPADVTISKVFCNEWYGKDIANFFNAEWVTIDPERTQFPVSATHIRYNPEEYREYIHPLLFEKLREKTSIDFRFLENPVTGEQRKNFEEDLVKHNPAQTKAKLFDLKKWNIEEFSKINIPVVVGKLENAEKFSAHSGIRVLDMPLYMPEQGWQIPGELRQFEEFIAKVVAHERMINPNWDKHYVYITIDQKPVQPQKSQRRPGWHSDAYITNETGVQVDVTAENKEFIENQTGRLVDRTYLAYDVLPTKFSEGPFPLQCDPEECEEVLQTFDEIAESKEAIEYPNYTILRLDPYDVHASTPNTTDITIERTFVKMSFSQQKYNREGNTTNPLLNYHWQMVPRNPEKREHRNIAVESE